MEEQPPYEEPPITVAAATAAALAAANYTDNDDDDVNDDDQKQQSKELAIQTLLEILDSNDIQIDDQLRRAILGQVDESAAQQQGEESRQLQHLRAIRAEHRGVGGSNNRRGGNGSSRRSLLNRRASSRLGQLTKRESIWGFNFRKHSAEVSATNTHEQELIAEFKEKFGDNWWDEVSFECRVMDGSYSVEIPMYNNDGDGEGTHIPTVTNAGTGYKLISTLKQFHSTGSCQQPYETKVIMKDVNLVFEEGKMYLILGAPGCGKSTLLKMIAGRLPESGSGTSGDSGENDDDGKRGCFSGRGGPRKIVGGKVEVNGINSKDTDIVWSNVVSYVDQIERLHGYLTVKETVDFAFDCCWGGTHRGPFAQSNPESDALLKEIDKERWLVDMIMRAVGIKRVADTYVGNDRVRGVSGGEKKRVSVAEMLAAKACKSCFYSLLFCCMYMSPLVNLLCYVLLIGFVLFCRGGM